MPEASSEVDPVGSVRFREEAADWSAMTRMHTSARRNPYLSAGLVSLFTLFLYLPVLKNGFVIWDDDGYVVEKLQIRSFDWAFWKWAFTDLSHGFWHPLTFISYAVDYAFWGLNPLGYHLTAALLHAVNTFLVVILVLRLFAVAGERIGDRQQVAGGGIAAAVAGLLFGIHPLHVESVAWVSERKDLLCALFFLLSLIAYLNYGLSQRTRVGEASRTSFLRDRRYLLALLFFVLALASKTMAVSLPVVLLILDWYPLERLRSARDLRLLLVEKIPFIAGSLIISVVSIIGQRAIGALSFMENAPFSVRILVAFRSLISYLLQMVVPRDLLPLYPYPKDVSLFSLQYPAAIVLVLAITAAGLFLARRRPIWLAAWSYYVITLLPVLGLVQVGFFPAADRFTYLPSLGPFLLAGLGAAAIWERATVWKDMVPVARIVVMGSGIIILAVFSLLTVRQIGRWRDSVTLWSYVIEREGHRVPTAYNNRGVMYAELQEGPLALTDFNTAIDLEPNPLSYNNRGRVYRSQGRLQEAYADYTAAVELDPKYYVAYNNRGVVLMDLGKTEQALEDFATAIRLNPRYAESYANRGIVYGQRGDQERAIAEFSAALGVNPYYADAYTGRGLVYERTGRPDMALRDLTRAVALKPESVEAHLNLGVVFERLERFPEAISEYDRVIALAPDDAQARLGRAACYRQTGRMTQAKEDYEAACALGRKEGCALARSLGR